LLNFKHSGNAGDIIYSLPAIKAVGGGNIFLNINRPLDLYHGASHPLKNVMLNREMVELLKPLLLKQGYINEVELYENQHIDCDLDGFRTMEMNLSMGNISRWYVPIIGQDITLHLPWIDCERREFKGIILARSSRYNNPNLQFRFLENYPVKFIGLKSEYQEMKKRIRNLEYLPVSNFLEMAEVIKGAELFIGNQSMPFAIAEGVKVNRILEPCLFAQNVIPSGGTAIEVYNQEQFESAVKSLMI